MMKSSTISGRCHRPKKYYGYQELAALGKHTLRKFYTGVVILASPLNLPRSFIIDDLQRKHQDDSIAVIYFYCDYRQRDGYSSAYILSSLLKQLVSTLHPLPHSLMDLFAGYKHGTDIISHPRLDDVCEEFFNISRTLDGVFVVVDALDECDATNRAHLLQIILRLGPSTRLLITSRSVPDIVMLLQDYPKISLSPKDINTDIETYINSFIQRTHLSTILAGDGRTQAAREQVKKRFVDEVYRKSQGL